MTCPLPRYFAGGEVADYCNRPSYVGPQWWTADGWCVEHLTERGFLPLEDNDVS